MKIQRFGWIITIERFIAPERIIEIRIPDKEFNPFGFQQLNSLGFQQWLSKFGTVYVFERDGKLYNRLVLKPSLERNVIIAVLKARTNIDDIV